MPRLSPFDRLPELIGDARIVAVGENNHHIQEFSAYRDRVLRLLVTELGFSVLGFESGYAEGRLTDAWLHGAPGEVADIGRDGFTFSLGDSAEMHTMLTWLREHNAAERGAAGGDVRYLGLDVPGSAGSPEPALRAVREYLLAADPGALSLVDNALTATRPYSAVSSAIAPGLYQQCENRDAATAALAVLVAHLGSTGPVLRRGGDAQAHAIALHQARGALRVDTYLREVLDAMNGSATPVQGASRDRYMAESVRLAREIWPDRKILLMLHNGHLQRTPSSLIPGVTNAPAGAHLADEFGDEYFALALTAGTGHTTGLRPDPEGRLGFRLYEQELGAPEAGSIEEHLVGAEAGLLDLRPLRAAADRPHGIRHAHLTVHADVPFAFDALAYFPRMRVCRF
ncbi:erythromycin esterase family protein [Amycolatopsis magusensis]|uniref:erythromycin esterase family protein n=1 Tax=Amycolatopsis magusensis TaxID=882444 RepID=UPI0024A7A71B|nr:erythromycin esterase family protein [Amycolatopsis magusensis]MDI5980338.1 erythromycin esterase family protein [Amycolatopsis magusensis]